MHAQDRTEAVSHCSKCLLLSLSVATETEQKQKEEQEQKLNRKSYIPVAVNIYFCSCFTCIIFCCNRNQINRKKQTVIWFERVTVVHYKYLLAMSISVPVVPAVVAALLLPPERPVVRHVQTQGAAQQLPQLGVVGLLAGTPGRSLE